MSKKITIEEEKSFFENQHSFLTTLDETYLWKLYPIIQRLSCSIVISIYKKNGVPFDKEDAIDISYDVATKQIERYIIRGNSWDGITHLLSYIYLKTIRILYDKKNISNDRIKKVVMEMNNKNGTQYEDTTLPF